MGLIANIKTGIEARLAISIPSYTRAAYQSDISMNKFKGNSALFAVHPVSATEVDGLIGAYTLDHQFKVTLTNSYNAGAKSQIGDSLKSSRITEINDDILATYRDLVINKGNIDASILLISEMSIEDAEFIDEEKVITVTFTFNIKYKVNK